MSLVEWLLIANVVVTAGRWWNDRERLRMEREKGARPRPRVKSR